MLNRIPSTILIPVGVLAGTAAVLGLIIFGLHTHKQMAVAREQAAATAAEEERERIAGQLAQKETAEREWQERRAARRAAAEAAQAKRDEEAKSRKAELDRLFMEKVKREREAEAVAEKARRKRDEEEKKYGSSTDADHFAKQFVTRLLRYPDKAEFSWLGLDRQSKRTEDRWSCNGSFKATNGFGVTENMSYVVLLQYHDHTWYEISTIVLNEAGQVVGTNGDGHWKNFGNR